MAPVQSPPPVFLSLDAVVIAVTAGQPRVLSVSREGRPALPSGWLDPECHPTLERGLRDWVLKLCQLPLGYVEQLYTFGDRLRDPRERASEQRVISAAYLALVRESTCDSASMDHLDSCPPHRLRQESVHEPTGRWSDIYALLPWEDWRAGRPALLHGPMAAALARWAGNDRRRGERVELCFGLGGAPFDPERTLERYELLWESGLVEESSTPGEELFGRALALDHRRILATALGRLRGKLRYRPVVFELLPAEFTLSALQKVVEALAGNLLHTQNFRRLVEQGGLVEGTSRRSVATGGRPAELFRFRHEVLRERPAPGVHFPGAWW